MALIQTQNQKEKNVVDDVIKKCLKETVDLTIRNSQILQIVLEKPPNALSITSAVAIGLLGAVLTHKDFKNDEVFRNAFFAELMKGMKNEKGNG